MLLSHLRCSILGFVMIQGLYGQGKSGGNVYFLLLSVKVGECQRKGGNVSESQGMSVKVRECH